MTKYSFLLNCLFVEQVIHRHLLLYPSGVHVPLQSVRTHQHRHHSVFRLRLSRKILHPRPHVQILVLVQRVQSLAVLHLA